MNSRKTVLVTGSSKGIGLGVAEVFSRNQYNIVLNCKNNVNLMEEARSLLCQTNDNVMAVAADVSDYAQCKNMFTQINERFGGIDILVNNAGVSSFCLFNTSNPEDWRFVMEQNFYSTANCSHLAAEYMVQNKGGCIVNISSVWGITGASCEAMYSASKGAVNSFTKALAKELAPSDIRVNAVACGVIDTDMNRFLSRSEKQDLTSQIPLMRFGEVSEVAALVYHMAENRYMTGQIVTLDGGLIG